MSDTAALNSASPLGGPRPWHRGLLGRQFVPILATLAVFLALYAGASIRYDNFLSLRVFSNLVRGNAMIGITAIGMTFVILSGGIDLSVGAMIGFVSIAIAVLIEKAGLHPLLAIPIVLMVGTLFGLGQGLLVAGFALPPFLVTLAGLFLLQGAGLLVSRESIGIGHPLYESIADFSFDVFPIPTLIFALVVIAAIWTAHQTRFGRHVYAVGGNEQSALFMGVAVARTKVLVYAISGFCAALAGVVSTFDIPSGEARRGTTLELDAIAAVVIGGTLLTGGSGYVVGTLVGVLILGVIQTILSFEGTLDSYTQRVVVGGLLLAFILLQKLIQRRAGA